MRLIAIKYFNRLTALLYAYGFFDFIIRACHWFCFDSLPLAPSLGGHKVSCTPKDKVGGAKTPQY